VAIVLYGVKASGKTTYARKLANQRKWGFVDTDDLLVELYAKKFGGSATIPDIYNTLGEGAFRELEHDAVSNILVVNEMVIAVGGSTFLDSRNVAVFKDIAELWYLQIDFSTFLTRLNELDVWPSIFSADYNENELKHYFEQRVNIYEKIADKTLPHLSL